MIPVSCDSIKRKKSDCNDENTSHLPKRHIIRKAIQWKEMLDNGEVGSLSELAKNEGLTRARVTQIMNLLKLPAEMRDFLAGLDDPREIRKYSERRLRKSLLKLPLIIESSWWEDLISKRILSNLKNKNRRD